MLTVQLRVRIECKIIYDQHAINQNSAISTCSSYLDFAVAIVFSSFNVLYNTMYSSNIYFSSTTSLSNMAAIHLLHSRGRNEVTRDF